VDLHEEDGEEGMWGLSRRVMRGARATAENWEMEHTEMLRDVGYRRGDLARMCSTISKEA
jgi:hypothetical protein